MENMLENIQQKHAINKFYPECREKNIIKDLHNLAIPVNGLLSF